MIPAIDPCGYLWANQGTKKSYFLLRPTVYFAQPIWFLLPLVCCFERFFSTNNMHETYFLKKTFFEIKNTFVWNKKHGFQENKHYFFRKTTRFFFIFGLLPWKFIESLLQTFSQTFRGGCTFDWNFQCKLAGMGWKFHCKFSRLDCKQHTKGRRRLCKVHCGPSASSGEQAHQA